MECRKKAHYELEELKLLLVNEETRVITQEARKCAYKLGFIHDDEIVECCLRLTNKDIYKTMESERVPGLWQDVYRYYGESVPIYIKLQKAYNGNGVVIAFKEL